MAVKKQHYVPKLYLKGFLDADDRLWAFRRDENGMPGTLYSTNIDDVCAKNRLYEVRLPSSSNVSYIEEGATEDALSRLENLFAPSLSFLREFDIDNSGYSLEEVWEHIAITNFFIASLIVRNPKWIKPQRAHADSLTRKLKSVDFFSPNDMAELEKLGYASNLSEVVELGIQHAELFNIAKGSSLDTLSEILAHMGCRVLKSSSSQQFITSSFPIAVFWRNENDEVPDFLYFPISASSAVMFVKESRPSFGRGNVPGEQVMQFNKMLLSSHDLWDTAIARDRNVLELCKDFLRNMPIA